MGAREAALEELEHLEREYSWALAEDLEDDYAEERACELVTGFVMAASVLSRKY